MERPPTSKKSMRGYFTRNKVTLRIYNVTTSETVKEINRIAHALGTGAYHAAVEINGAEWSYGYVPPEDEEEEGGYVLPCLRRKKERQYSTGVFWCYPGQCEEHDYREKISMGKTKLTPAEIEAVIARFESRWLGCDYDLLRQNCCHFSDAFCQALGVGPIPSWVTNLANTGGELVGVLEKGIDSRQAAEYEFGDFTRGVIATGKEARGARITDTYRCGDCTRGCGRLCCRR